MITSYPDPHWTAYVTALLTPLLTLSVAIYIAVQQWRTARNKLKLDLFEKRFSIYDATRKFVGSSLNNNKVEIAELYAFWNNMHMAKWLLNAEVYDYLDKQISDRILKWRRLGTELSSLTLDSGKRTEKGNEKIDIETALVEEIKDGLLDRQFAPFLQLKH